ncbi:unnamed protein product [Ectocarpus sp. CCAP 1310/34]|nr:unnamed protein product [Ectocarpus sp. CCAP 1310/34]
MLNRYETAAGGRRPKVILTDADLAMTAAIASCWPDTLHLHCLWHIFKNVLKNCSSSFPDNDAKADMMRTFRRAAYAATPEVRYRSIVFSRYKMAPDVYRSITPLDRVMTSRRHQLWRRISVQKT